MNDEICILVWRDVLFLSKNALWWALSFKHCRWVSLTLTHSLPTLTNLQKSAKEASRTTYVIDKADFTLLIDCKYIYIYINLQK